MSLIKIVVFGIGQTSDIVSYYFEKDSGFEIVAYTIDDDHIQKPSHNNRPVIPFSEIQ